MTNKASINQEGSLKDWKEKFREWDEGRCKFEIYRDTETLLDWIEENVIAPLLQKECKGDDLESSSKSLGIDVGDAVRSTVESRMGQCEYERCVIDFFGLPESVKEDTVIIGIDFGLLVNLLAEFDKKKNYRGINL